MKDTEINNDEYSFAKLGDFETQNSVIEKWLNSNYDIRYNSIRNTVEFKRMDKIKYSEVNPYVLRSFKRQLESHGLKTSVKNIEDIIGGEFSKRVNPIKDYFEEINDWDKKTDYIKELSETIKTNNDNFYPYLKKWLVATVANIYVYNKCTNHTILVLTGSQGKYKTTWLEHLCPKTIKEYSFLGHINTESKDTFKLITQNLIINIDDQLKQLNKRDENQLKSIITIDKVTIRVPFAKQDQTYQRIASFVASINGNEFLSDPTGNRRYLPFEAISIDIDAAKKINMDRVWEQALSLFKSGFEYWFSQEDIEKLAQHNKNFEVISQEEELFNHYYRKEEMPGMINTKLFLPPAIILSKLEFRSHLRLSQKKLGEALTKLKIDKVQKTVNGVVKWGYFLYEKDANEIDRETNEVEEMHEF